MSTSNIDFRVGLPRSLWRSYNLSQNSYILSVLIHLPKMGLFFILGSVCEWFMAYGSNYGKSITYLITFFEN